MANELVQATRCSTADVVERSPLHRRPSQLTIKEGARGYSFDDLFSQVTGIWQPVGDVGAHQEALEVLAATTHERSPVELRALVAKAECMNALRVNALELFDMHMPVLELRIQQLEAWCASIEAASAEDGPALAPVEELAGAEAALASLRRRQWEYDSAIAELHGNIQACPLIDFAFVEYLDYQGDLDALETSLRAANKVAVECAHAVKQEP